MAIKHYYQKSKISQVRSETIRAMNPDRLSPSPGQQDLSAEPSTSTGVRHHVPPVVASSGSSSDESDNAQIKADRAMAQKIQEAERAELESSPEL